MALLLAFLPFSILTDQAMGATIDPADGIVELCLDRRLNQDDGRGLGEPVTDNIKMSVTMWVAHSNTSVSHSITGYESHLVNYPPLTFVGLHPSVPRYFELPF
mgnify:CR=1 FL=1